MNRRAWIITIAYVCVCLLLSLGTGAGVCVGENESFAVFKPAANQRLNLPAGESVVALATDLTGEYTLFSVSEGAVHACVTAEGQTLAEGDLPLTFTLRAAVPAEARLSAAQPLALEWMRAALGRSLLSPIELGFSPVNRSFTRAYDTHWFSFTAPQDGEYLLKAVRAVKSGVTPQLLITDENGAPLAVSRAMEDACAAFVALEAGQKCLLRLNAPSDATGNYTLCAELAEETAQPLTLSRRDLALSAGEWTRVDPSPLNAVIWESDDPDVATVNSQGVVAAQRLGQCVVTAYGAGGGALEFSVTVGSSQVQGVSFTQPSLTLAVGEEMYLDYSFRPVFVRDVAVRFTVSNPEVASVSADGRLLALGVGETEVRVEATESGFADCMTVYVTEPEPVRRALAVGIASYVDGRTRLGSVNTTQGMADALAQTGFTGANYQTVMRIDLTARELLEEIELAFAEATPNDISLLYINCHGNLFSGLAFLEMHDGSYIGAQELEQALRRVPGTVVVVLDCCFSGAFIGSDATPDSFVHGVVNVFSQSSSATSGNVFASDKYKVLVSSSMDQSSYRMASSSPAVESSMSTVFGRAFAEGLGWDLIKDRGGELRADLDGDRRVTLNEAFLYVRRRAMYYLTRSPASTARQFAQVWPEGDCFVLLG